MIYRTKSFSINNYNDFPSKPLRKIKSTLDIRSIDAELRDLRDIKRFISVKKGDCKEVSSAISVILNRLEEARLDYDFLKDNWKNEKKPKDVEKASCWQSPKLGNILKSYGMTLGHGKETLTKEEINRKEEIINNFHRYQNAKMRFISIKLSINPASNEDKFFIAYYFSNPIGILQFSTKNNTPTVVNFAMHYLVRNCGYLLMECAVNESLDLGKEGKIQLDALPRAEEAYFNMGFLKSPGDVMILEPAISDKWCMIEGCYKYMLYQ
ncbi:hypothetical protein [Xenorhabdus kozodoii]|uniref:N-acetyltransferase n=1 Tax=Xenorhabdus kozodoii TaxID=351676 RepID=A0A2D0L0S4_9GAMM|nr:hypothetical protein [Xenorhabdus kozodoii]PHM69299.1 N-acetyltransferase [Xenorhabdus kozodoii]